MLYRNIRAEMARLGLTSKDMAQRLGISAASWRAKMRNASQFNTSELQAIKRELHCSYEYLLDETAETA